MNTATNKQLEELSYAELLKLANDKKAKEIVVVQKELTAARGIVSSLEARLLNLGVGAPSPARRGRKKGSTAKPAKVKKGKGRDTGLKDKILAFLKSKGAKGAHVDEIAKHAGKPKNNINAFLASTGKKAGVKGKGNRSGIYYLTK